MTQKRFVSEDNYYGYYTEIIDNEKELDLSIPNPKKNLTIGELVDLLNALNEENEQLKKELKRCKDWLNSDKYDYQLTLAFIKNKGYSLKDVLEYEKELEE